MSSSHETYGAVGFESVEATRLGLEKEQMVQVTAEDNGKHFHFHQVAMVSDAL